MPTVAEQLREAREAQNLTVYQVAEVTKIRTDHIRALDEGNYNVFSAPVYIRGFVRTYATLLKLDVPQVMKTLQAELSKSDKHHDNPPLAPKSKSILDVVMFQLSRLNWRVTLPLIVILIVIGIIYFAVRIRANHQAKDPFANVSTPLYQPTTQPGGETLPLPPARR